MSYAPNEGLKAELRVSTLIQKSSLSGLFTKKLVAYPCSSLLVLAAEPCPAR